MAKHRLFVDMDGTTAVFTKVDMLETLYEKGYFLNLEPVNNVLNAVKLIIKDNPDIEVNILSAVLSDSEYALEEKNQWLDKYLPEIDREHRIFPPCGTDKKDYIEGGVRETDFLLDDYTNNLTLWQPPARGIKILNGINHTRGTWEHDRIRFDKTPEELAGNIVSIMRDGVLIKDDKPIERSTVMATFYKSHANPSRFGTKETEYFIQEYTDKENSSEAYPGEIVFMGSSEDCISITNRLNNGDITAAEVKALWNENSYSLSQTAVRNIAKLDYVNGLPRNVLTSEQFAKATESVDNHIVTSLYETYMQQWDAANTTDSFVPKYAILQLAKGEDNRFRLYTSLNDLASIGKEKPDASNYEVVYIERLTKPLDSSQLNSIYDNFNANAPRPSSYYGHSLSISDVVVLAEDGISMKAFYVDDIGFTELPDFLTENLRTRIATNIDVRVEHSMLDNIRSTGLVNNTNIFSERNNSRYTYLTSEYSSIFDLADKRAILEQIEKLNTIHDYELMYGGESNADSITQFDHFINRVMLKPEVLRDTPTAQLQKLVDATYKSALKDLHENSLETLNSLNVGDIAFLYKLSNGVNIVDVQSLIPAQESYIGYDTSTGEEVTFTYEDIEAVRRNGVEHHREEVVGEVSEKKPFTPNIEQADLLNALYSAIVTRHRNPNDELLQTDISERLKSFAQTLDHLHVPFAVQNAVAAAAEIPQNWSRYNDTVLQEVYQRGYLPQTFIDRDSQGVAIAGHTGTWHTIDVTNIDGQDYFLLEHDTYGDEAASIIVNTTGMIILDDVYNGFDDLKDHFESQGDFDRTIKEWNNIFFKGNPAAYYTININNNSVPTFHASFNDAFEEYKAAGLDDLKSIGYSRDGKGGVLLQYYNGLHHSMKDNLSIDLDATENLGIANSLKMIDTFCEHNNPKIIGFVLNSGVYQVSYVLNGVELQSGLLEQAGQLYYSTGTAIQKTLVRHNLSPEEVQRYNVFVRQSNLNNEVTHGEDISTSSFPSPQTEHSYYFGREDAAAEISKLPGYKSMIWEDGDKPVTINGRTVWGTVITTELIDTETQLRLNVFPVDTVKADNEERSNVSVAKQETKIDNTENTNDEKKTRDLVKEQLQQGIRNVMESDQFRDWCKTSGKLYFNNYSFRNAMLTYLQKPDSSYVMGYEAWKEFGRQVKKGASGIKIFTPSFAKEYVKGGLYKSIKSSLSEQLKKAPELPYAVYHLGQSKLSFTMQHNGIMGLMIDGRDVQRFNSDDEVRKFIDRNVLGKVPMYYGVASVFDVSDTYVPEYLWMKNGFSKDELALNEKGDPVKSNRGEYKLVNTPERQARFNADLDLTIPEGDIAKMETLFSVLQKISNGKGIPMTVEPIKEEGTKGFYERPGVDSEGKGRIAISDKLMPTEKVAVAFHEMTHSDMHLDLAKLSAEMGEKVDRNMREVQAEAVAFMTASNFGIDTQTSSFNYLAAWSKGKELKELELSLDKIFKESKDLMKSIEKELDARGLDIRLEPKVQIPLSVDERNTIVKFNMGFVLSNTNTYDCIQKDIADDLKAIDNVEEKEIVTEQCLIVKSIKADLGEISKLSDDLLKSEVRAEQNEISAKIAALVTRIDQAKTKFDDLSLERIAVADANRNTLKKQFDKDPAAVIGELKKTIGVMKDITDRDKSYLAKSVYISREYGKLLKDSPELFARRAMNQLELTNSVSSKNGTFVEIINCENWGENKIFEKGTVAHPKAANKIFEEAERQIRNLKVEAQQNGDYYPYSRCDFVVFTPNDKDGYYAFRTSIDIGDGTQRNLLEHMEQACANSAEKGIVFEKLSAAVKERVKVADKVLNPKESTQEQVSAALEPEPDRTTLSVGEWKSVIGAARDDQGDGSAEPERENEISQYEPERG